MSNQQNDIYNEQKKEAEEEKKSPLEIIMGIDDYIFNSINK